MPIATLSSMPKDYVEEQGITNHFHFSGEVEHPDEEATHWVQDFVDNIDATPSSILDIGCRSGYCLEEFKCNFPSARIVGVDIVHTFITYVHRRNFEGYVRDVHDLHFNNDEFDWTFCTQTLEHAYNFPLAVDEIYRITASHAFISLPLEDEEKCGKNPSHFSYSTNVYEWLEALKRPNWDVRWLRATGSLEVILCKSA